MANRDSSNRTFGAPSWMDEAYIQHAESVGQLVVAWARLHEHLGQLFAYLVATHSPHRGWAAWHAIYSDSQQRSCLRAVTREVYKDKTEPMREEIEWVLTEIGRLIDDRNSAVHVAVQFGLNKSEDGLQMIPVDDSGNPKAVPLVGKDLGAVFEAATQKISRLSLHAQALAPFLRSVPFHATTGPLPQRPPEPTAPHSHDRRTQDSGE